MINFIVILLFVLFFADLGYILYLVFANKRKGKGEEK